jgi:hypothetical protein
MHPPHPPSKTLIEVPVLATCTPFALTDAQVDAWGTLHLPGVKADTTLSNTFDCSTKLAACAGGVLASVGRARQIDVTSIDPAQPVHEQVVRAPCKPVTYLLHLHRQRREVKVEIEARGPLLVTLHVSSALCKHWSHVVSRRPADVKPFMQEKAKDTGITVAAALVGWSEDECWLVQPAWSLVSHLNAATAMPCIKVQMNDVVTLCPWVVGMLPEAPPPPLPLASITARHVPLNMPAQASAKSSKPSKVVKAKVKLGHGDNKTHENRRALTQLKEKVSAGDIASITFMAITCALIAVVLCMLLSRWCNKSKRTKGAKRNDASKVKV